MSCSHAAVISTARSFLRTVPASSAARFATPWVCNHRSGRCRRSNRRARSRASRTRAASLDALIGAGHRPGPDG